MTTNRRRAQPEAALQRAVFEHLQWRTAPNTFAFHVPNGGWRSPIEAAIMRAGGVVSGVPDLIIIHAGKCFGLELKSAKGRTTAIQKATHQRMRAAGAQVSVCFNIDSAVEQLSAWGLLR